jgi:hypothetical protein
VTRHEVIRPPGGPVEDEDEPPFTFHAGAIVPIDLEGNPVIEGEAPPLEGSRAGGKGYVLRVDKGAGSVTISTEKPGELPRFSSRRRKR